MRQKMEAPCVTRERDPVKQSVSLKLSEPAYEALTGARVRDSYDAAVAMGNAIRVYLGDRGAGRPAWPYPDFMRGSESLEEVRIELTIDEQIWRSFVGEAERQDIEVQQLAEHAAFYLAAEIDAGRVTQRIVDDLESSGEAEG